MKSPLRSERLQILAAVLAVLAAGAVGYAWLFGGEEDLAVVITQAEGQILRTSPGGPALPAGAGTRLEASDSLRVGPDGRAELGVGPLTRLTLEANAAVRVVGVDRGGVQVELEEGRVSARVRPGSPALQISNLGRTLSATDADFAAAAVPGGGLVVETTRGEVARAGFGPDHDTPLPAGSRLSALPGQAPVLEAIPAQLLLSIDWPPLAAVREEEFSFQGQTTPHAEVTLRLGPPDPSGVAAPPLHLRAGPDGRFQAPLTLREGENLILVQARDVLGRQSEQQHTVLLDTRPPVVQTDARWGGPGED